MSSGHLKVPISDVCAFCEYLSGRRPYTILYREPLAAIFVTREQRGASHLLVAPTRHVPTILDLEREESHAIMDLLRMGAAAIDAADRRPGISIWQNNGTEAAQTIPHLHVHVAGTVSGGGTNWDEVAELSIAETEAIADRLRPNLP
jgi:histidine triad (HIT) family protein